MENAMANLKWAALAATLALLSPRMSWASPQSSDAIILKSKHDATIAERLAVEATVKATGKMANVRIKDARFLFEQTADTPYPEIASNNNLRFRLDADEKVSPDLSSFEITNGKGKAIFSVDEAGTILAFSTMTVDSAGGANLVVSESTLDKPSSATETLLLTNSGIGTLNAVLEGTLQVGPGGVTAPSLSFNGDPDTGLYSALSNQIGFTTGGFQAMTLTSAGLTFPGGNFLSRQVLVERATSSSIFGSGGMGLLLQAGGALPGASNASGGALVLSCGISTGIAQSTIQFHTPTPATSSGATDNTPTEKMRLYGDGTLSIGNPALNPTASLYAETNFTDNSGAVAIFNRAPSGATGTGTLLEFQAKNVTWGSITQTNGVVSYNSFTGSHLVWIQPGISCHFGQLLVLTGINKPLSDEMSGQSVYGVQPSSRKNDKRVFGAYLGPVRFGDQDLHLAMAVGDGFIWVTDKGGDIEVGDFLTGSSREGHAQRQGGDSVRDHTAAKALEAVEWSHVQTDPAFGFKRKLIPCTFKAG